MEHPHSKLLAAAAKRHLTPLGVTRKGRSRTWLDDRRWFVTVVEFQPSGFSKGSYLNVGAHFLWSANGHLSFDLGYRVEQFIPFESEEQFTPEADRLAARAAIEVLRLRSALPDPSAVATMIPEENPAAEYHRGIALGLTRDQQSASHSFHAMIEHCRASPVYSEKVTICQALLSALPDAVEYRSAVNHLIHQQRHAAGLPAITEIFA